ncbi:ribosome small subunit-dependent GTPase A [Tepidibacillus decaturensis]|uniref:Small ribosomal subunit biogenesis GTPase RsgA n=1 Tax=Tepidibacillus decaturensis TaxID=1413211 RepID=A0A135L3Z2_9BACI|nr:ribosome small subunit-dependent GTPase A [Tepidibacillus decaturensis]KXG43715.1 GTPase RsgA [Tepidibacillus decaturensis]
MPEGQIVKALSSFYYVESEGKTFACKARGVFKLRQQSPLVGDYVSFDQVNEDEGFITEIKIRKNQLIRPPISNVDQAILVFSAKEPDVSTLLLDKFIVHVEKAEIKPIICITKLDLLDLAEENKLQNLLQTYEQMGYSILKTSSKNGKGIEELNEMLKNKISVFAGQSGVGKSSLLNAILPDLQLETSNISFKLGRGKHTTRVVQLIHLSEGGMVADTPGFSQLDFHGIESEELNQFFKEIHQFSDQCRYRGCLHLNEPGCAVKEAVNEQLIDRDRYEHYISFLKEIKEKEENKWR